MFPSFVEVGRANVDDRESEGFRRGDDEIVVLGHLEVVEGRGFLRRRHRGRSSSFRSCLVENSLINRVGNRVVD